MRETVRTGGTVRARGIASVNRIIISGCAGQNSSLVTCALRPVSSAAGGDHVLRSQPPPALVLSWRQAFGLATLTVRFPLSRTSSPGVCNMHPVLLSLS